MLSRAFGSQKFSKLEFHGQCGVDSLCSVPVSSQTAAMQIKKGRYVVINAGFHSKYQDPLLQVVRDFPINNKPVQQPHEKAVALNVMKSCGNHKKLSSKVYIINIDFFKTFMREYTLKNEFEKP